MILPRFAAIVALTLLVCGCAKEKRPAGPPVTTRAARALERFEYSQIHMGVRTRLVVYATDETAAVNACRAAFARVAQTPRGCTCRLRIKGSGFRFVDRR